MNKARANVIKDHVQQKCCMFAAWLGLHGWKLDGVSADYNMYTNGREHKSDKLLYKDFEVFYYQTLNKS